MGEILGWPEKGITYGFTFILIVKKILFNPKHALDHLLINLDSSDKCNIFTSLFTTNISFHLTSNGYSTAFHTGFKIKR